MKVQTGWIACAILALSATGVLAQNERLVKPDTRAAELAAKGLGNMAPVIAPLATVNYSSTIVGGPTWTRPFADCTGASGLGPFRYHTQNFNVTVSGAYTLSSVQDGWDGYIFVYNGSFDPSQPLVNCIVGNDDDPGIGASSLTTNLTTGTNYVYVTTSFEDGEEGTFTNTITGPGDINLVGGLPSADLGIVKSVPNGVATGGTFIYRLAASNAGPAESTLVRVSDTLPAGVSFVSSTCGATAVGQTVTWNVGTLASGGNASCDLTVNQPSLTCPTLINTATITSPDTADGNGANNSSTISNGGERVADGSFELDPSGWTQASSNFGTPLCTLADCGTGGNPPTVGPRTGDIWAWFGGIAALEVGSVQQTVTIPVGANTLSFGYWLGLCGAGAGANDFVRATIGGTEVWRRDAASAECGAAGYTLANVDISAFATGAAQVLRFESTAGTAGTTTNFSIDDISIAQPPACVAAAAFNLNTTAVNFGNVAVGSTSAVSFITLTNTGSGSGTVQAPVFVGPFARSGGTCPSGDFSLAGGANCTIGVVFTATTLGSASGTMTVNAGAQALVATLNGSSVLPAPAFIPVSSNWMLGLMIGLMGLLAGLFLMRRSA